MTCKKRIKLLRLDISTHILTKRMTGIYAGGWLLFIISTHILTKRMTGTMSLLAQLRDISTHILTKRMTVNTTSRFARFGISTHILTKRMTAILNKNNLFKIAYYINNKHFISIVDIFFHFHIYF